MSRAASSERSIIFFVGAVQFVNVLDFMMVMPLGPDFAKGLSIAPSHLGYIGGAYTASAAVSGLLGSLFLENFDRRKALGLAMLGLVIGTALGGFAWDLPSLIAARVVAGAFGGPATSLALAIVADRIPPERRGRAMGSVMSAFAVASTLGVPGGLRLATIGGWRLPFFAVAGLGLVVAAVGIRMLPPMTTHLDADNTHAQTPWRTLFTRPAMLLAYVIATALFMSSFMLVPNISPFVQINLHFPREHLDQMYMLGGICSFFVTRLAGRLIDRFGASVVATGGVVASALIIIAAFGLTPPLLPVWATFMLFFTSTAFRNVPINTLMTLVPAPNERARFMSVASAVQHMAAACGAFLSSEVMVVAADGRLHGMVTLAELAVAMSLVLPPLLWMLQRMVRARVDVAPVSA